MAIYVNKLLFVVSRVLGIFNLHVADASIMPRITNANLNAPTMMIGEKAADLVLKFWNK